MKIAHIYMEHPVMSLNQTFLYRCNDLDVKKGVRVRVPFHMQTLIGFVDQVEEVDEQYLLNLPYEAKDILEVLDEQRLINEELDELADYMSHYYIVSKIACFQAMLPSKLKPQTSGKRIKMEDYVVFVERKEVKTSRQKQVLHIIEERQEMKRSLWLQEFKSIGKVLEEAGCVKVISREVEAIKEDIIKEDNHLQLHKDQIAAIKTLSYQTKYQVSLLHGVTGSGKTEVFLQLAKEVLEAKKQVLILVPEISLTPQMVKRVTTRFGSDVAIYHSGLNDQEKYEQYRLVEKKKVSIVVGTRSAIFMPFQELGLIILDEEHDQSYKQDSNPKYHTRDIALWRAKYHQCRVILASATPSLESYARAYKGVYQLVELPKRIFNGMPKTKLVEMNQNIRSGGSHLLSHPLKEAIQLRLDKKEQVVILLNRRGYTPFLRCNACGHTKECPHCDVAMSYHKAEGVMKCHMCGYQEALKLHCDECGHELSFTYGYGTQKLEELLIASFPQANILRMDADTTTRKNAHATILSAFERGDADILVGTQMISKGLDYPNVTLVGIVGGDAMLSRGDYRSVELTFDLLAQASGRSGRGSKDGEVYIQAFDTNHYAIQAAARHDYHRFFEEEMKYRHLAHYPPYSFLVSLIFIHKKEELSQGDVYEVAIFLKQHQDVKILGPIELRKIKDRYRTRIILKSSQEVYLNQIVHLVYDFHVERKAKSILDIDINPLYLE